MIHGLCQHLLLTLRLNFRSKQAIVYGYAVPLFFLLAFGSVFRSGEPPLLAQMGQLLTITVLGGACFGMPTAMVAERERGVWRRYRLVPAPTLGLIVNTILARYVIVLLAAVMQVLLARCFYRTPLPAHAAAFAVAFSLVCFALLGLGLIIAMLAENVPAVQAMGQAIFLPMIMIGGVGLPLKTEWARHVARFLPGRYAVDAIQAAYAGGGWRGHGFDLLALAAIGATGCWAAAHMFRWDIGQQLAASAKAWVLVALLPWAAIGVGAEMLQRRAAARIPANTILTTPANQPATAPSTATETAPRAAYETIGDAEVAGITYDYLEPDSAVVTPFAASLKDLTDEGKNRMEDFSARLENWIPGMVADVGQRARNLISVAACADLLQDPNEAEIPLIVFGQLKRSIPRDQLIKALAWIALKPDDGKVITSIAEFGIEGDVQEGGVRERSYAYAKKMLGRLLGKLPARGGEETR